MRLRLGNSTNSNRLRKIIVILLVAGGQNRRRRLGGWAVDALVRVSSAPPINVIGYTFSPVIGYYTTQANVVPGQPHWIADATQPAGRALNPAAFANPPEAAPGNFPRNGLPQPLLYRPDRSSRAPAVQPQCARGVLQYIQPSDVRSPRVQRTKPLIRVSFF
jgi:hypothetical protein